MALQVGTRLGTYEVISPIGTGGMGEVYRARDTKLNRDVALKVLPEAFAADPQRMARFEREAQVLASLNHPHIAAIYGLEESGAVRALVMELVEGPTLAERLAVAAGLPRHGDVKSPLQIDETLAIAKQIAEALEYAHERGIIHRDLKPANVKITPNGTVKVLDFGLAKAIDPASSPPSGSEVEELQNSPTISTMATQAGMIMGTAAYMSPEQARGKPVDRRADIWAFGCVLYEMLTGKRAFEGETVSDVLAAVITTDPDWSALPGSIPASMQRLVRRCLVKDPRQRLRDIGDARITIEETLSGDVAAGLPRHAENGGVKPPLQRRMLPWAVGVVIGAVAAGLIVWRILAPSPPQSPVLAYIPPPRGTTFRSYGFGAGPVVVSPDGKQLAFSATDGNGVTRLYVRPLASNQAQAIADTKDAAGPFWSPDGRSLGFFAGDKLKTVNLDNGNVQVLADASCARSTGAWSASGTILFQLACTAPLDKILSSGGSPKPATKSESGALGHWAAPAFLPDGRHFLFESFGENGSSIWMGSLDSSGQELVLKDASSPAFSSGELLFVRNHHTFAQPMDPRTGKLSGEATALADAGNYSVSSGAVLAYQGGTPEGLLEWYDRSGNPVGTVGPMATYDSVRISPDGKHILADVEDAEANSSDLWSYPASGGVGTRLTFGPGWKGYPVSSPDGKYIVYGCQADGKRGICRKPANGSGAEETLFTLGAGIDAAADWSPDGRYLSIDEYFERSYRFENAVFPLFGDRKPFRPAPVNANQYDGLFSPDGRWLAYFSYETGRPEVYVVPFPGPGGKFQISQNGGWTCKWDKKGNLYFLTMGNRLMEAELGFSGGAVQVKAIHPLFQVSLPNFSNPFFDVSADGSRFIFVTSADPNASSSITVLLNWKSKLKGTK